MKILVLGDDKVGKTALISKFLGSDKPWEYSPTIEELYTFNTDCVKHEIYEVTLDLLVYPTYFEQCSAFLIVFDVTVLSSFCLVKSIIERIWAFEPRVKKIYIFGTNADQKESRLVSKKQGKLLALRYDCVYMEGSTDTGKNVTKMFNQIVKDVVDKPTISKSQRYSTVNLSFLSKPKRSLKTSVSLKNVFK